MYNEKSNIYTITIIIFDSVRRNFDERSLSVTNEINKRIDPRPPSSYNDHDIVQLAVSSRQRSSTILLTSLLY